MQSIVKRENIAKNEYAWEKAKDVKKEKKELIPFGLACIR